MGGQRRSPPMAGGAPVLHRGLPAIRVMARRGGLWEGVDFRGGAERVGMTTQPRPPGGQRSGGKVDLRALLRAVADLPQDAVLYIDCKNGETIRIMRSSPVAELTRFKSQSDREPDRFVRVPRPSSEETFGDMAAFLATVKDKKLQERLRLASTGGGTLREFLDALTPVPQEKDRWYRVREARVMERTQVWLRSNGLISGV